MNSLEENFDLYFDEEALEKIKIKDIPGAILNTKDRGFESFYYEEEDDEGYEYHENNDEAVDNVIEGSGERMNEISDNEKEYIEELKSIYSEQSEITDRERRLLNRLSKSLGISEERAKELENQVNPNTLSDKEQEYAVEIKACLEDDGVISDRERRILNRLAKSLDITPERAEEIEKFIISK